jgi:hypothetical protein
VPAKAVDLWQCDGCTGDAVSAPLHRIPARPAPELVNRLSRMAEARSLPAPR